MITERVGLYPDELDEAQVDGVHKRFDGDGVSIWRIYAVSSSGSLMKEVRRLINEQWQMEPIRLIMNELQLTHRGM